MGAGLAKNEAVGLGFSKEGLFWGNRPLWADGTPILITLRPADESDNIAAERSGIVVAGSKSWGATRRTGLVLPRRRRQPGDARSTPWRALP